MRSIYTMLMLVLFIGTNLHAQDSGTTHLEKTLSAIKEVPVSHPLSINKSVQKSTLVSKDVIENFEVLSIDKSFLKQMNASPKANLKIEIPLNTTENIFVDLVKVDVFTEGFNVFASSNPSQALDMDLGTHYWGRVNGTQNSLVALSLFENELTGTINYKSEAFTLAKLYNHDEHIIFKEAELKDKPTFACFTDDVEQIAQSNKPSSTEKMANPDNVVRVYIEVDNNLFQNKGTVEATTEYIMGVWSQVALIYANDNLRTEINELVVWDIEDPYPGPSSSNYLNQFRDNLNGNFNGDIAHLLGIGGGGGIAYLDILCGDKVFDVAYSGINTTYEDFPVYSWTVMVVSHEMGHNLGSPHTHNCSWNGNGTAIDGCGPAAGYSEGCNGPIPPEGGTIMSYCHLNAVGINLTEGFGPQPGDLIRDRVYNAPCLTADGPTCTDGIQNGMETGVDCGGPDCPACPDEPTCDDGIQNGMEEGVDCGGPDCPICPTCDDGIQNGMETGVDCGGPDCPACPTCDDGIQNGMETGVDCGGPDCAPCDMGPCGSDFEVMLDIDLDNNQDQTTWDIKDASGAIVQSGGPYNKGGGGRFGGGGSGDQVVDLDFCLAEGCYVFTIYDSAGNGLSGNGSYIVTSDGVVLASGGSFGSQEATPFCLGDGGMEPTCDDGIQNGLEEGIDCGGPDCPACPVEPTCDDGIQNGMETGVDCGGPDCPACPVDPTCDDGIQNGMETGVDCGGPDCAPCDMGCDGEVVSSSDFESGLGVWNDGGSDCRRSASDATYANSGTYCVRLRDNSSSSIMTSDNIALAGSSSASISFSYIARSMDNSSEGFMVEYSTNGGASFSVAGDYRLNSDFQNNVRGSVDLEIAAAFTNSTQFRIRCDASTNSDYVYIDDVEITGCTTGAAPSGSLISNNDDEVLNNAESNFELLSNFSVYPNPVQDMLNVTFDLNTTGENNVNVRILNLNGQVVFSKGYIKQNGQQQLSINTGLMGEGMYHLVLTSDSDMKVKKFIVLR